MGEQSSEKYQGQKLEIDPATGLVIDAKKNKPKPEDLSSQPEDWREQK